MSKKLNIIAIIPARGGSKSILRKNIRLLNDKPLIYYVICKMHLLASLCCDKTNKKLQDLKRGNNSLYLGMGYEV